MSSQSFSAVDKAISELQRTTRTYLAGIPWRWRFCRADRGGTDCWSWCPLAGSGKSARMSTAQRRCSRWPRCRSLWCNAERPATTQALGTRKSQRRDQDRPAAWAARWTTSRIPCRRSSLFLARFPRPSPKCSPASSPCAAPSWCASSECRRGSDTAATWPFLWAPSRASSRLSLPGGTWWCARGRARRNRTEARLCGPCGRERRGSSCWKENSGTIADSSKFFSYITLGCFSSRNSAISLQADMDKPVPSICFSA